MISVETAKVYRAGGRRFFTLRAAAVGAAREKIRANCDCDYCDHSEMPGCPTEHLLCRYHDGSAHAEEVMRRLANLYMRAYRASRARATEPKE